MKDIIAFADITPFQTSEVIASSKALLAFGFEQDQIIEKTEHLGNIAAGIGRDKFGTLIRAFGKIKTKGTATMEELNMMLEAGVPILDSLGTSLGVSTEKLFKMITARKIGFEQVEEAIESLATGSGKFAGLMEKQSKSLFGLWSTIMGKFDDLIKEAGQKFLPVWKELQTQYLKWFDANRQMLKLRLIGFFTKLSDTVRVGIRVFVSLWRTIDTIVKVVGGWKGVMIILGAFLAGKFLMGIGMVITAVFGFAKALTLAALGIGALNIASGGLILAIGALAAALALLIQDFLVWYQGGESQFGKFYQWVVDVANGFKSWEGTLKNIMGILKALAKWHWAGKLVGAGIKKIKGIMGDSEGEMPDAQTMQSMGIPTTGVGSIPAAEQNMSRTTTQNLSINLNVEGMPPEQAEKLVTSTIVKEINKSRDMEYRETARDGSGVLAN